MRPFILIILYVFVILLPLGLAWSGARPPRSFWDELATGTGLLAFAVILAEFILSGRYRMISAKIGMDVTMRLHQLMARTALILALVHPFFYRAPYNPQLPWDVTRQLTLSTNATAIITGILAWVLLPTLVLLSVGREQLNYKYETWRLMHGLGASLIAGLVLHHALNAGRYSQDPVLTGLWIILFLMAIISLIYVYAVEPLIQMHRPWKVSSVRLIGLKTWELALEQHGHPGLSYRAGQFAWLNIGNNPFSFRENPFSISSAPADRQRLEFVIKELGDFTKTIGQIKLGTKAYVDGPHGNLVVSGRKESGIALIAGGVGVAPLMSILRQLHLDNDQRPTMLVYGNRVEEQIVYHEELRTLASQHGTRIELVLSDPPKGWASHIGLIDSNLIRNLVKVPEMTQWLYVLCGPSVMMEVVENTLINMGVPAHQIISERFRYD